jgi:hypothetical protein
MSLVSVKECDFLDQDPPLRGQNYVCLSFVSPEDVIKKKEVYFFEEFIKSFSRDMNDFFTNLAAKYSAEESTINNIKERYSYVFDESKMNEEYSFFVNQNSATLEEEYYKKNNFQTSIRGLKVRGVFDSIREAEIRSQVLKKIDDKFNVYVAQVGCWCPWSPNPEDIEDQEYAETQLNTLMKQYKDNQDKKDVFFQERKREMQFAKTKSSIDEQDPWIASKDAASTSQETPSEPPAEAPVETPVDAVTEVSTDAPVDAPVVEVSAEVPVETPGDAVTEVSTDAPVVEVSAEVPVETPGDAVTEVSTDAPVVEVSTEAPVEESTKAPTEAPVVTPIAE